MTQNTRTLPPGQLSAPRALALLLAALLTLVGAPVGVAQDEPSAPAVAETLAPALEAAARDGATVIVIDPAAPAQVDPAAEPAGPSTIETLNEAFLRLKEVWSGAGAAWSEMATTLALASPDGGDDWLLFAVLAGLAGVVLGRIAGRPVANWIRATLAPRIPDEPTSRAQKIGYLLFRGATFMFIALFTAAIGTAVVVVYANHRDSVQATGLAIVWTYAAYRLLRSIYINFLAPFVPAYRVINLTDAEALSLYRALMVGIAISVTILGLCLWMDALGLDENTHKLALMMGSLVAALLISAIALVHRQPIARAILGVGDPHDKPFWLRTLARSWHVLAVLYVMSAWAVSSIRLLLDQPASSGLVGAPLTALIGGLVAYGFALIVIDLVFARRAARKGLAAPEPAAAPAREAEQPAEAEADAAMAEAVDDEAPREPVFKRLIEHAAALVVTVLALAGIAEVWGADLSDPSNPVARSLDIILVVFGGYLAYRAAELWIDSKSREEYVPPTEIGDDPGGAGATRLATLLPIFRNFLLITIVVIAGMIALLEMGVDIAPLFAGAGVIGLAIGFGAQTLIRDILSGAFFLLDDAFRLGEYIDIGTAKGTVEKISIRSMQLRHHNGPLNTIPFGEIKQLNNFSRDWVMMKLPLRLTYDTDVERVRKLVKKLGQELLEHPTVGHMFLQPLKSQGVLQMDDSAMIVRVKFMTKPGDQFMVRKVVYQRIRDLFEENDIHFAHREVTVRIAEQDRKLSEEEKKAIAGAVRPVIDDAAAGPAPAGDSR